MVTPQQVVEHFNRQFDPEIYTVCEKRIDKTILERWRPGGQVEGTLATELTRVMIEKLRQSYAEAGWHLTIEPYPQAYSKQRRFFVEMKEEETLLKGTQSDE